MNRRPFVGFSILYVCGIYISDKFYNKQYIDMVTFLVFTIILMCLWTYKFSENYSRTFDNMGKEYKKRNYVYMCIGIAFLITGAIYTVYTEKRSVDEINFKDKSVSIKGEVYAMAEKANTYAITLVGVKDSWKTQGKVLVYLNKEKLGSINSYKIQNSNQRKNQGINNIERDSSGIEVGCYIQLCGEPSNFLKPTNPGQFDERTYYVKQLGYKYKLYANEVKIINSGLDRYKICKSIYFSLKRVLYNIKNILKRQLYKIYSESTAGLISGIILGEKSLIDEDTKTLYQSAGISHILAISGLHITILGMCIYKLLSKLKLNVYIKNCIVIFIIVCYGIMTDFSISTNRAVVMMVIMLVARFFGRSYDIYTSLALSLIIILMQNPLLIYHSGLLFSYGAIIGIIYVCPALTSCIYREIIKIGERFGILIDEETGEYIDENKLLDIKDVVRKFIRYYINSIIMGIAIYLITLPIMINTYHEISILSIFINVIVLALSEILIILCFITPVINVFSVKLSYLTAGVPFVILKIYEWLGNLVNGLDINRIIIEHKPLWQIFLYYSVILMFIWKINIVGGENKIWKANIVEGDNKIGKEIDVSTGAYVSDISKKRVKKYYYLKLKNGLFVIVLALLCSMLLLDFSSFSIKENGLDITMLDVSQGDGICIQTPKGKVVTVDGGSSDIKDIDKYRLVPFLKYKGIDTIDYTFISHVDTDHISGILALLSNESYGIKVRNVVLPYVKEKNDKYIELEKMAKSNGINVLYFSLNNKIIIDNVIFKCLHPSKDYQPLIANENSYSEVILMSYKKFDMLFTGDLEADGEKMVGNELVVNNKRKIDVIKVPHHGSKNSSTENFISIVNPKFALISAGANNRYGHPHKETLERYRNNNTSIYTTIENGALTVKTDGRKIEILKN